MRNNPEQKQQMFEMIEQWQQSGVRKKHTASSNPLSTTAFINPYEWLKYVLERMHLYNAKNIKELLPQNWKKPEA